MGEYHRGGGRAKSSVDVVGAAILAKEFPHYPSYQLTVVLSKAIVGKSVNGTLQTRIAATYVNNSLMRASVIYHGEQGQI